ncbi:MAG: SRPBCC family protein [Thermodesulfobacteriota bacterium]
MIIKAVIQINAPRQKVWEVFADIENWKTWNPVCRECRFEAGKALVKGTCISFELNPLVFSMRIAPKVTHCSPGEKVVWEGSRLGIHAVHEFYFAEKSGGVELVSIETFSGPLLVVARMIGVPSRLHALTVRLLDAIRQAAESSDTEAQYLKNTGDILPSASGLGP